MGSSDDEGGREEEGEEEDYDGSEFSSEEEEIDGAGNGPAGDAGMDAID